MNKKIILGILIVVVLGITGMLVYPRLFPPRQERRILYWTDPMIPGDRSDHPGKSPMGMDRQPVYANPDSGSSLPDSEGSYYTCPMHPSVRSDKPGSCPVCGMALVKRTDAKAPASQAEVTDLRRISMSPAQRVIANVATAIVGRTDIDKEIRAVGVVDIAEPLQAKVTARFNGRIEKLFVGYSGAYVKKGDPLFELHSPDLVSAEQELILAVNAAAANPDDAEQAKLLEASHERLHIHFGMTPDQIAGIEQQRTARETMTFLSPISGTVISKDIQEGDYVNEGTLLYQLADLSHVWVYLDVYERDLPYVHVNHPVRIRTEAYPNELFAGKVTFIDPVVDPETRTVRVRSEFSNPSGKLKPKMFVSAEIHAPATNALTVPASSVLYTGKKNIVWLEVEPNTFEPRDVTLGTTSEGRVEILQGLHAGDTVVTSGGFLIESESQLQHPADQTPGAPDGNTDSGSHSMKMES